jgi:Spy/CpxP family protein refolding chaperone
MKKLFAVLARAEFQAVALLLVVSIAGGFVGVALDRARGRRQPPRADGPPRGGQGGMQGGPRQGQRLPPYIEALDLSSDQHDRIRTILQAQRPKVDSALATVLPQLQRISDSTFASIRAVLTPEQQKAFDTARPQRDLAPGIPRGGGGPRPPRGDGEGRPPNGGRPRS